VFVGVGCQSNYNKEISIFKNLGAIHPPIETSIEEIVKLFSKCLLKEDVCKDVSYMCLQSNLKSLSPIFFYKFPCKTIKKNFNSSKIEFWFFEIENLVCLRGIVLVTNVD